MEPIAGESVHVVWHKSYDVSGKFSVCIIAIGRVKSEEKNIHILGGKGSNGQNNS